MNSTPANEDAQDAAEKFGDEIAAKSDVDLLGMVYDNHLSVAQSSAVHAEILARMEVGRADETHGSIR